MKTVRYIGDLDVILPIHGIEVKTGDEFEVEDEFNNALFEVVVEDEIKVQKKKGEIINE